MFKHPLFTKLAALTAITVLLLFGLGLIEDVVRDRLRYRSITAQSVAESLAGPQTLMGPMIHSACVESWDEEVGKGDERRSEIRASEEDLDILDLIDNRLRDIGLLPLPRRALQWRGAMLWLALGVLLLGGGATLLLQRAPSASGAGGRAVAGHTLRQAMATPHFRWFYLMTVLAGPVMFIPFAHVSAAARDLGVADARAVGLVGLIGIGSLTGRFAIGALADRVGRPITLALAMASMGLCFLAWWAAGGWAAMAVFSLWMGLSYGGIVSLMPAMCMDLFGARAVSAIIGTLYTGAAAGNLLGPWVAGAVFDATGSYTPVIWGCLLLSALATAAAWRLVGPPPPPAPAAA